FQTDAFNITGNTYSRKYHIGFNYFFTFRCLDRCLNAFAFFLYLFYGTLGHHVDAFFLVDLTKLFSNVLVFYRYNILLEFNQSYFSAYSIIEIRKLYTNSAGPNNHQLFRLFIQLYGFFVINDHLAVNFQIRQLPGTCTRSNDKILSLNLVFSLVLVINYFYLILRLKNSFAFKDFYFVGLHQKLDAFVHFIGHIPAALDDSPKVWRSILDLDAIIGGMF